MSDQAIYSAEVWHRRIRPRPHAFRYRVFYLMVDTDQFESGRSPSAWLSFNRFNLFSLYRSDYGNDPGKSIKTEIAGILGQAGNHAPVTRIMMLTLPRILGYAFNPITLYFCYSRSDGADSLQGVVYEVHNTFGEKHFYAAITDTARGIRHSARKAFHVSPFYRVEGEYDFQLTQPGKFFGLLIKYFGADGSLDLTAGLRGKRFALTGSNLLRHFLRIPFETLKVTFAIHYEAARLWFKRIPVMTKHTRSNGDVSDCEPMVLSKDPR